MPIFRDRVCETSTTTGTGNFTLNGAIPGYSTFSAAGIDGTWMHHYLIETVDSSGVATGDWEIGAGVITSSTTMVRSSVFASSNAGALVNFGAGTKRVHLTGTALQFGWQGCVVYRSTNLTAQNFTTATAVAWEGSSTDTDSSSGTFVGFFDPATATKFTFPMNAYDSSIARLRAQISLANITVGDWVELKIRSGATVIARRTFYVPTTAPAFYIETSIDYPAGGSQYDVMVQVGADTSVDLIAADSFFELEVLQ